MKTSVITRADSDLGVTRSLPFFLQKNSDQISTKILVQKDFFSAIRHLPRFWYEKTKKNSSKFGVTRWYESKPGGGI